MVRRQAQQKRPSNHARSLLKTGSGGGIRTPDLWVMSPTSCRCSTPRRALALRSRLSAPSGCASSPSGRLPASVRRVGGVRGGLASRGVAPTVLSGAALGHDRVRDGTGWGQHALGHGHPPPPASEGRDPTAAPPPRTQRRVHPASLLSGRPRALHISINDVHWLVRRWRISAACRERSFHLSCGGVLTSRWHGPPRCRATTPDVN